MTQTRDPGDDLLDRLRGFIDEPTAPPVPARDPVNLAMIRHWCDAMGDHNPAYLDEEVATGTRHGGIVAPPAMLQSWCMDKPQRRGGRGVVDAVMQALTDAGFTSVVATNYDQEYLREVRIGDRLHEDHAISDVSPLKHTALGDGHFVTMVNTYRDDAGELVGTSRMRVLRFRPKAAAPAAGTAAADAQPSRPAPRRPRPPVNRDTAFFWDGVARGELLIQRCSGCATLRHPPAPMCGACGSLEWDTVRSAGRGTVHSWVRHHHPPLPGFDLPITVVLVDLEEGVRLVADLEGAEDVYVGMPVHVDFVRIDDDTTLPRFRPASGGEAA